MTTQVTLSVHPYMRAETLSVQSLNLIGEYSTELADRALSQTLNLENSDLCHPRFVHSVSDHLGVSPHLMSHSVYDTKIGDVHVLRCILNESDIVVDRVERILAELSEGDACVVQYLNITKGFCAPRDYAFDAYLQFMSSYAEHRGLANSRQLVSTLNQNSTDWKLHLGVPALLQGKFKELPMAVLSELSPYLIRHGIMSSTEFRFLTHELEKLMTSRNSIIRYISADNIIYKK